MGNKLAFPEKVIANANRLTYSEDEGLDYLLFRKVTFYTPPGRRGVHKGYPERYVLAAIESERKDEDAIDVLNSFDAPESLTQKISIFFKKKDPSVRVINQIQLSERAERRFNIDLDGLMKEVNDGMSEYFARKGDYIYLFSMDEESEDRTTKVFMEYLRLEAFSYWKKSGLKYYVVIPQMEGQKRQRIRTIKTK
jgi:hypothetical protein